MRDTIKTTDQSFWIPPPELGAADPSRAITSFLCTSQAREIFGQVGDLDSLTPSHPEFRHCVDATSVPPHQCTTDCGLMNAEVLAEARAFRDYAVQKGRRGTPHNA